MTDHKQIADLEMLVELVTFARKLPEKEPLKSSFSTCLCWISLFMGSKLKGPSLKFVRFCLVRHALGRKILKIISRTGSIQRTVSRLIPRVNKLHHLPPDAVGTCSMLPRSKNGVVDPNLRVYKTKNIRVADLSIVPLHISGHTQGTLVVLYS